MPSKRTIHIYDLDAIIVVGYRVKSKKGLIFRRWADAVLRQYLIEGYSVHEVNQTPLPDNRAKERISHQTPIICNPMDLTLFSKMLFLITLKYEKNMAS